MGKNTPIQNEAVMAETAPVLAEWSAPQVEALSVAEETLRGIEMGDDGDGFFTAS